MPAGGGKQRRALTQARRRAPVDVWGDPPLARALAKAIDVAGEGEEQARRYTHGFHSWPARMHPLTARRAIAALALPRGGTLLDPFCGGGTVLVEGMLAGFRAWGVDANPLAALVARARTFTATPARRKQLVAAARRIGALVVAEGKAARRAGWSPPAPRAMPGVDAEARNRALAGAFDGHVRAELEALAAAVAREPDAELRALLEAILSSILIKMSRRAADTDGKAAPARKLGRGMAARLFAARAEELGAGLDALAAKLPPGTPPAEVREGDARGLGKLGVPRGGVAAVVSSPPYPGTYDYLGHHELRLAFLGLPTESLESRELGARRRFRGGPGVVAAQVTRYESDMTLVLREIAAALAPGGRCVWLVGDSLAGQGAAARALFADEWLPRLAQAAGLTLVAAASQHRELLGGTEKRAFGTRAKREHLVCMERGAGAGRAG